MTLLPHDTTWTEKDIILHFVRANHKFVPVIAQQLKVLGEDWYGFPMFLLLIPMYLLPEELKLFSIYSQHNQDKIKQYERAWGKANGRVGGLVSGLTAYNEGTGIHALDHAETQANRTRGGLTTYNEGIGIHALDLAEKQANGRASYNGESGLAAYVADHAEKGL
ncbi:expressed unknown protein [Seminavis robusta]|uniref:Uncharacterized protein n=1 Tax=Seminavis robusta TaxID=568900 RepID=A0A9N8H446_9STRA|nr:expressed unknown protein [Seminavis robusta]|eukprot:Sro40_g024940.1 n/a (165) ;mRNA; r:137717-138211